MGDEETLDLIGKIAAGLGILIILYAFIQAGTVQAFLNLVQAGSQLIIVGVAAIVGGGAVMAYFRSRD